MLLRLLLKKAPKWITVLLWGIVAVRLICPFTIESALSLIPSAQTINPEVALNTPAIDSGVPIVDNIVNPVIGGATISFQPEKELNFFKFIMPYLAGLWLVGIAVLLVYTVVSYAKLKKKIGTAVLLRDNIFQSESVVSPFVLGIIKPKIYLPFNMNEQDMEHVIAHEQAHIRRKDHWWKPFGFLLLTIHWFNPLMWLGYVLLCRDIELACDEKVIKELNTEQKADYSQALLTCSVNRRMIAACPLAFGEVGVKNRVKSVLNYKKPAFWIIIVAVVASIVVAVCFLTNPRTGLDDELSVFLDMQIAEHHYSEGHTDDNFITVHHKVLDVDKGLTKTTVYMWVLYHEYSYENGEIKLEAGAHTPTVITAERTGSHGHYELVEYWTPRDGSYYAPDIKDKFPLYLHSKALDSQRYIGEQKAFCENAAKEYFSSIANVGGVDGPNNVTVDSSKKPPTLTVSCGNTSVNAWLGTYSWLYKNLEDGTAQAINADSSHPLSMIDKVPTLSIIPSTLSSVETRHAVLQFANTPDKIEVKCYKVDEKDTDKGEMISVKDMTFQMKEGQYLYEIIAEWTDAKENSGKAYYAFQTIMPDLEIVDMNTVETNIFAGTIRDTYLYSDNKLTKIALGIPKGTKVYVVETDTPNGSAKVVYGEYMGWTPSINLQLGEVSNETVEITSAIASVLNEKYRAEKPDGLLHIENYYLLANEVASGTPLKGNSGHMEEATVYLLVYHMKYSVSGGQLEEVEGGFVPTAISFKIDENGQYTLKEYWTPRSGANYEKDVLGKFPGESATDVLNTEQYAEDLIKENWRLANEALSKIKS